jgi:hypothetical protein
MMIDVVREPTEVLKAAHRKAMDGEIRRSPGVVADEKQLHLARATDERRELVEKARTGLLKLWHKRTAFDSTFPRKSLALPSVLTA